MAIKTHAADTYGDFLSPIRANFQKVPSALKNKNNNQDFD